MEAVIIAKEGRVGVCIDICLEMSSGIQTPNEGPKSPETKAQSSGPSSGEKSGKEDTSDLLGLEGENGVGRLNLENREHRDVASQESVNLMD